MLASISASVSTRQKERSHVITHHASRITHHASRSQLAISALFSGLLLFSPGITADSTGVSAFQNAGYKLDGIEGYLYPKTMTQPAGSVRLMRKYNPARDDHAIFPESQLSAMAAQGYTQNSGSDWIGYVYPNTNGNVPAIN